MCPSSRSWPLKTNLDTGKNTGRDFTAIVSATVWSMNRTLSPGPATDLLRRATRPRAERLGYSASA
jgi:hypothetical protein